MRQDAESEEAKVFEEVYLTKTDQEFAMSSSPEVFQKYDVKGKAVVLFKKVRMWRLLRRLVATDGKGGVFRRILVNPRRLVVLAV